MKYQLTLKEYISYSQDVNKDKSKEIIQSTGFNTSSMLVINHLVKVNPPKFCFMKSLHSTAITKKNEFLRPFSRPLRKLKKSCLL